MKIIAEVTKKRITIPKKARDYMNLKADENLFLWDIGDEISIIKIGPLSKMAGKFKGMGTSNVRDYNDRY